MPKSKRPPHVLWAPWRMEYIQRPRESGCFLCRSLQSRDDRANGVVWRGRTCAVVLNRYPYTGGHLMVAPLRHVARLHDLRPAEWRELMRWILHGVAALERALHPQGFNIGLNLGEAAGAGLKDHLHWHIVPRWVGDTNFMPVLGRACVTPTTLEALWDHLRAAAPAGAQKSGAKRKTR